MKSYEYYLLFHQDEKGFIRALIDKNHDEKEEILIALENLLEEYKVNPVDLKLYFNIIWAKLRNSKTPNERLQKLFVTLLTVEFFESVKIWIFEEVSNFGSDDSRDALVLRVLRSVIKDYISMPSSLSFFLETSVKLVEFLYHNEEHLEVVGLLHKLVKANATVSKQVCDNIWLKSRNRHDPLALQNICCFFDEMCIHNIVGISDINFLSKYLDSSEKVARKQGLYLIETLALKNKFSTNDQENFEKFITIVESLQESSHLILPMLNLIKDLRFSQPYADCVFILLRMIIFHESSQVRDWGINFILSKDDVQFTDNQAIIILSALNSLCLYDIDNTLFRGDLLKSFIERNFDAVFRGLEAVNWSTVPFYRIFVIVLNYIKSMDPDRFDITFIHHFLRQTDVIPRAMKNLTIRSKIQVMYSECASVVVAGVGVTPLRQILVNIFNMGEQHKELEQCFKRLVDFRNLLTEDTQESFAKFILFTVCVDKDLDDIIILSKLVKNSERILIQTILHLNLNKTVGIETYADQLNRRTSANIISSLEARDISMLSIHIETFELEFQAFGIIDDSMQDRLTNIWMKVQWTMNIDKTFTPYYWIVLKLIYEFHQAFDLSLIENEVLEEHFDVSLELVMCLLFIMLYQLKHQQILSEQMITRFLSCIEKLVEDSYVYDQMLLRILEVLRLAVVDKSLLKYLLNHQLLEIFNSLLGVTVNNIDKAKRSSELADILLITIESPFVSIQWINDTVKILESLMKLLKALERSTVENVIMKTVEISKAINRPSEYRKLAKFTLTSLILGSNSMTKEQQLEMLIEYEVESTMTKAGHKFYLSSKERNQMRLRAAEILSSKFAEEFPNIIEAYMEGYAIASSKERRYFPNGFLHRHKLHCLQAMIFCKQLTKRTLEILRHEMLLFNNQPCVTVLLEIILARYFSEAIDILKTEQSILLKSFALKSIFPIIVMRETMLDSFKINGKISVGAPDVRIAELHDVLLPYMMGSDYGVRSYSQATIVMLYNHMRPLFNFEANINLAKVARTCRIINDSTQFKKSAKYVDVIKKDFRFVLPYDKIWRVDTFYKHIPRVTKMPIEEILYSSYNDYINIYRKTNDSYFKAAIETDETIVVNEEISVPLSASTSSSTPLVNLQQKYLPFRFQVPTQKLMKDYPSIFQTSDTDLLRLQPKSKLIVVASLIGLAPNLGGLARSCEIFGAESFIINNLKQIGKTEFQALSRTADRWMKIAELRPSLLFDYLLAMKHQGYCIVGAEQSGKSVSLFDAKIPLKTVLLLGNEKEGIPANLLALLDLTIEIPQFGVVRSLNVHVSGALLIWEYAKQNLLKSKPKN